MKIILAYIPVLHAGYLEFLDQVSKNSNKKLDNTPLWLIDPVWARQEFAELDYLRKEIRAVKPEFIKSMINALYPQLPVKILTQNNIEEAKKTVVNVFNTCDEDITKLIAKRFFPDAKLKFFPIFLRWDVKRVKSEQQIDAKVQVSQKEFDQKIMAQAFQLAGNSNDWWRHVGAILVSKGKIVAQAYNHHTPTPMTQYIYGDPRTLASSGVAIEISTSVHAEGAVIAQAARQGIKTEGLDLYVTTFPCPYCARLVAGAGIARLFFTEGYNQLESQELLENAGVQIIQVKANQQTIDTQNRASIVKTYIH